MRIVFQQRVLARYNRPFFESLAAALPGSQLLFIGGSPDTNETLNGIDGLDGASLKRIQNLKLKMAWWQRGLRKAAFAWGPDVLIVEANPRILSTWILLPYARLKRVPVIGWGLGVPPGNGVERTLWRIFLRPLSAAIAYGEAGGATFVTHGIHASSVFIAPNSTTDPAQPEDMASPSGTLPIKLLYVGRLEETKKIDRLIEAVAFADVRDQFLLRVVGGGSELERLRSLAQQTSAPVVFDGPLSGDQLRSAYSTADVFVMPGTGGLALQEALSFGLPVMVGAADGTADGMATEANGWRIQSASVESIHDCLLRASADPSRLPEMGRESRRLAEETFNLSNMVSGFVAAINNVKQ